MIKGFGSQMEPTLSAPPDSRTIVNSNLVSFSIVADPRSIKVELSSPIELIFKHNVEESQQQKNINSLSVENIHHWPMDRSQRQQQQQTRCAHWDTSLR